MMEAQEMMMGLPCVWGERECVNSKFPHLGPVTFHMGTTSFDLRKGLRPVGHRQAGHTRMAEVLRQGDAMARASVIRAEERIAQALIREAGDQIRRVGQEATEQIGKARGVSEEPAAVHTSDSSQPTTAEEGIQAEDTTFLYGDRAPAGASGQPTATSSSSTSSSGPTIPLASEDYSRKREFDLDGGQPAHNRWEVDGVDSDIVCGGCNEVFKSEKNAFRHLKVNGYHRTAARRDPDCQRGTPDPPPSLVFRRM